MLTLFTIPSSTTMISEAQTVVTAWVPEFLPVIYLTLGVVVVVGTIMLVKSKLGGGIAKILGTRGRRSRRGRR